MSGEGWWDGKGEEKGVKEDGKKEGGGEKREKERGGGGVWLNVVDVKAFPLLSAIIY